MPNFREFEGYLRRIAREAIARESHRGTPVQVTVAKFSVEGLIKEKLAKLQSDSDKNYASLSLSENRNNLLMWSHYCDSHRGFVVGFDANHSFFNTTSPKRFRALEKVKYTPARRPIPAPDQEWSDIAEICFFTKSDCWAYEEEHRMIASPTIRDDVIAKRGELKIYLFKFPPESLKEVILGYRMLPDTRRRIEEAVAVRFPKVKLYQAILSETEFELDIRPLVKRITRTRR